MVEATQRFDSSERTRRHDLATSSTVARWELAHRIKVRRRDLGISVDQIAKHFGFTRNFFSAVEHERSMLATDKLEILLVMLEFDDDERDEMMALDEAARQRGWWEAKEMLDLLGDGIVRFIGLEQGASTISTFESLIIPGLMQIPDYTRAVLSTDPMFSQINMDDAVDVRIRRQRRLLAGEHTYTALLSEASLHQFWGGRQLQSRQLEHIADLVEGELDVTVRVLPFRTPPGIIASSSTLVFTDFSSPHLPTIAFQEAIRDVGIVERGDSAFKRLRLAWEIAERSALSSSESIALIRGLATELT